ncbi:NAD(P)H-hydrate epimerase [Candidatus Omnitrophota bacterium]
MQELDRKTIEDIGIPSIVLMENAGRAVSKAVVSEFNKPSGKEIAVFCGTGNNGGDGFVSARYLIRHGFKVSVYIIGKKSRIKNDPLTNLKKLETLDIKIEEVSSVKDFKADLIIDAIFGIGLKGEVNGAARSIIADINKKGLPVLSVDVPSGLDADTGIVLGDAVMAKKTITMQFPKKGFYINKGPEHTGEIIVADIGIVD